MKMGHVMVAVPAIDVFSGVLAFAMPAIDDLFGNACICGAWNCIIYYMKGLFVMIYLINY